MILTIDIGGGSTEFVIGYQVKKYNIEKVIGSSGTIRKIEKAVYKGYAQDLRADVRDLDEFQRDWCFNKEDLKKWVEKPINEKRDKGVKKRRKLFNKRSGFIVAGAVVLEEIFISLGLEEMEV
ncbi:hypothetical protein LIER_43502 [Lithospermum erythrorhizon]|uniref:Ppx/GppA phosphatase domain-containing protein n=1 Tax=Lithospermum erythrorhizon TaxID=34254 RepID=A0AAV3QAI7_LITER